MEWINVNDKLPEEKGKYLCVVQSIRKDYHYHRILDFHPSSKMIDPSWEADRPCFYDFDLDVCMIDWTDEVLYWMPLPELPGGIL